MHPLCFRGGGGVGWGGVLGGGLGGGGVITSCRALFFWLQIWHYLYVFRVEMLRYRYGLQGGNATLSLCLQGGNATLSLCLQGGNATLSLCLQGGNATLSLCLQGGNATLSLCLQGGNATLSLCLQGGNATLSLWFAGWWKQFWQQWRSIGRPVQQEQCESPLPNVSMKLKYLGWPEEILLSSRRRTKRPDRIYKYI